MAYKITEECIACGACVPECPAQCIAEGDPIYGNANTDRNRRPCRGGRTGREDTFPPRFISRDLGTLP
ncbi:MAG: ferredoxin family protein [Deltaproteobacteria bacterium]|nr:ferredoxin family protein [Deltaproteobacteria bacterium]